MHRKLLAFRRALAAGDAAILVGAGVSMAAPTGLPGALGFLADLFDAIAPTVRIRRELAKLLAPRLAMPRGGPPLTMPGVRFEQVLSFAREALDHDLDLLRCYDVAAPCNAMHAMLAALCFRGNSVLTTNFDGLIESALPGRTLTPVVRLSEFARCMRRGIARRCVYKLHGSWHDAAGRLARDSICATLEDVARNGAAGALPSVRMRLLERTLRSRPMLVLGYSGGDVFDIVPQMLAVSTDAPLLWIDHQAGGGIDVFDGRELHEGSAGERAASFAVDLLATIYETGVRPAAQTTLVRGPTEQILAYLGHRADAASQDVPRSVPAAPGALFQLAAPDCRRWYVCGKLFESTNNVVAARKCFATGRLAAREERDPASAIACESMLAGTSLAVGDLGLALAEYRRARELARRHGAKLQVAVQQHNLAVVYLQQGRAREALRASRYALRVFRAARYGSGEADAWSSLAQSEFLLGNRASAMRSLARAEHVARRCGALETGTAARTEIAERSTPLGRRRGSERMLLDALNAYALLGDLPGRSQVLTKLGCIARDAGELPQARAYFKQQLQIERALGNRGGIGNALLNLACVDIRAGRLGKGSALLRSVRRVARERALLADVACLQGQICLERGRASRARTLFARGLALRAGLTLSSEWCELVEGQANARLSHGTARDAAASIRRHEARARRERQHTFAARLWLMRLKVRSAAGLLDDAKSEWAEFDAYARAGGCADLRQEALLTRGACTQSNAEALRWIAAACRVSLSRDDADALVRNLAFAVDRSRRLGARREAAELAGIAAELRPYVSRAAWHVVTVTLRPHAIRSALRESRSSPALLEATKDARRERLENRRGGDGVPSALAKLARECLSRVSRRVVQRGRPESAT